MTQVGIDVPIGQIVGFSGFVNKLVDLDVFMTASAHTNWNSLVTSASFVYNAAKQSSGAQNDEINFEVTLSAGTWTYEQMHSTGNNRGVYTVTLGDISAGTIDGYDAAANVYNVFGTLTGIQIPKTGVYRLKLKMASKNAASSNYFGVLNHIQLRRTT